MDSEQLSRWFDTLGRGLVLYARQWLPDERAEDVVQEVFLRLARQTQSPKNPKAWLVRSVRNECINRLRARQRRRSHEQDLADRQPRWFERRDDDMLDAATAQQALEHLPVDQRELIVLKIWAGMTYEEISEVVMVPVSTVHRRYAKALTTLRKVLESSCRKTNL